ncbi:MAG: amidohydrolase family protein [bacterium]
MIRIADSHVHIFGQEKTAGIQAFNRAFTRTFDNMAHFVDGLPEHFDAPHYLEHAKAHGVEVAINLPVARWHYDEAKVRELNIKSAELVADNPGEIYSFGSINPRRPIAEIKPALDEIVALGLLGVKLHPIDDMGNEALGFVRYQQFDPADPDMDDVYRAIADRGLRIFWHAGSPIIGDRKYNATPPKLRVIYDRFFQGMPMELAHAWGQFESWDEIVKYLADLELVNGDLAYTQFGFFKVPLTEVIRVMGAGRLRFGVDFPFMSVNKALEGFEQMAQGITQEDRDKILYGNAVRHFGLDLPG